MGQLPPPRDPIEVLGEAYELLLEKSLEEAKKIKQKSAPALHKLIEESSAKLSDLSEITEEQAEKISDYLKRDLKEAANYMQETGEDFKKWLGIDIAMVEDYLFNQFKEAADQTTIELMKLKQSAETSEYHTGEITGPGVLLCDNCGEQLHFHKAGHIPPCPQCKHTLFHRLHCI